MYDFVIVGAGLAGSVIANRLAFNGYKILILEKRAHIGGNVYDEVDDLTGVLVQRYGPHIFHTNNEEVWSFLKDYSEWVPFEMKCGVEINNICTPSPFNFKTIDQFFISKAELIKNELKKEFPNRETATIVELLNSNNPIVNEYAMFLFDEDYSLYTAKQWGISPEKVDINVLKRVPVRLDYREGYFTDKYQFMPKYGFSALINNLLSNQNITVLTNTDAIDYIEFRNDLIKFNINDCEKACLIWTGPVDSLFRYKYGLLPYRSLDFKYVTCDCEKYQNYPVMAYPKALGFTRITDYNLLPPQGNKKTIIAYEYPKQYYVGSNTDPYYPINNKDTDDMYNKYLNKASSFKNLYLLGRLAKYKYFNMDQVVMEALEMSKGILKGEK